MKFSTGKKTLKFENHLGSGDDLTVSIKAIMPVNVRQGIMEVSSDFSVFRKSENEGMSSEQLGMISKNLGKIYEIVAKILIDWDAFDDSGKAIEISADTVAFVLGEEKSMEIMNYAITPPTKAENSQKQNSSPETI